MTLGDMVLKLQRSLCKVVATEGNLPALAAACRAMATLLDQAPLSRLPEDLLVEVVEVCTLPWKYQGNHNLSYMESKTMVRHVRILRQDSDGKKWMQIDENAGDDGRIGGTI
jgi:Domain of unknown function (DUF4042)